MIEEVTGEGVAEMTMGTTKIRHFGVRGGKLDVRLRAAIGPEGIDRDQNDVVRTGIGATSAQRGRRENQCYCQQSCEFVSHVARG